MEGTAGDGWHDEIDLGPAGRWLRMGTRNLGWRPWLVVDDRRGHELALKARLSAERHHEVFAALPGSEAAAAETLGLVEETCRRIGLDPDDAGPVEATANPLDRAGRIVQEDLCLLRRQADGWTLAAASLCFPSRWRLADKMGLPVAAVHGPVDGYDPELVTRVDRMLDRLADAGSDRIVWRRNWFIHPTSALFQPGRPVGGDPLIPVERCLAGLFLRSERQTLRRLPTAGWILFTIRIQQDSLATFVADRGRRGLAQWLAQAPVDEHTHRGLTPAQVEALDRALASPPA